MNPSEEDTRYDVQKTKTGYIQKFEIYCEKKTSGNKAKKQNLEEIEELN